MNILAVTSGPASVKRTLCRGIVGVCALASGVLMLSGCSSVVEAADQAAHRFSADSSLFGPAASTTYRVSGTIDAALNAQPSGTIVISNGMITSAEFVASVKSTNDVRFVLTEPALYERRGEVLESIQALGTLSTHTALYPDTRITLTPDVNEQGTRVNAAFEVPDSLTADSQSTTTVHLELFMEPLATFDDTQSESQESEPSEAQSTAPSSSQPE